MKPDKQLPCAPDAERYVIGCILIEQDCIGQVADFLQPEMFYDDKIGRVYRVCQSMFNAGEPVGLVTITNRLKAIQYEGGGTLLQYIGGHYQVIEYTKTVGATTQLEFNARIIVQKYIARELWHRANRLQNMIIEERDTFQIGDFVQDMNSVFMSALGAKGEQKQSVIVDTALAEYERQAEAAKSGKPSGVPSGLPKIDRHTGGWQKPDLIILAGRPAMGKTSFAMQVVAAAAAAGNPMGVMTLEMSTLQLVQRLIVSESGINSQDFRNGTLGFAQKQEMERAAKLIHDLPIYYNDTPAMNVFEARAIARRWKQRYDIQMLMIDYLQLMTAGNMPREQEVSLISRTLKQIAKELDIPVIALSQMSRDSEKRGGGKWPQLSDLRESGSIEQDADMVMFLHRPEYYGMNEDRQGNVLEPGTCMVCVEKYRSGAVGDIALKFIPSTTKFIDPSGSLTYNPNTLQPNLGFTVEQGDDPY